MTNCGVQICHHASLLFAEIVAGRQTNFEWHCRPSCTKIRAMKNYTKILLSILVAAMCTVSFAAEKPNCKATGKNCPMNKGKICKCGKECGCAKM